MNSFAMPRSAHDPAAGEPRGHPSICDGLFRHIGVWAPGVRRFRKLGFAQKAFCISLVFMVPIVLLTGSFVRIAQADLANGAKERLGVAYQKEVLAALRLALEHQWVAVQVAARPAEASADIRSRFGAQMDRFDAANPAMGAALGTADSVKALGEAAAPLAQPGGSARAVYLKHADFIDALLDLASQVADTSGLALDPELASCYLISASILDGPDLLAQLAECSKVEQFSLPIAA